MCLNENEADLSTRLERENDEYRRLKAQHHDFDEKLRLLSGKRLLTEQERLEEIRLKKEKLFLKDRMAAIERAHSAASRT